MEKKKIFLNKNTSPAVVLVYVARAVMFTAQPMVTVCRYLYYVKKMIITFFKSLLRIFLSADN